MATQRHTRHNIKQSGRVSEWTCFEESVKAYKSCVLIQGLHPLKHLKGLCEVKPAGAGSVWTSGPQKDTASEPGHSKKNMRMERVGHSELMDSLT